MSALDVIFSRRFVRVYTDERLDKATVRALLDAPVQAPTALHAVPGLVVVEDVKHPQAPFRRRERPVVNV